MKFKLSLLIVIYIQFYSLVSVLAEKSIFCKNKIFALEEATIESIHCAIRAKQLTCEQLITAYLERIKKYNLSIHDKPPINSIAEINPFIISNAKYLDKVYSKTNQFVGPMHCVPVILKDNIDSYETTTSVGSFSLLGNHPVQDAFLVAQLRKAGAIFLGQGAMDEFAWGVSGINSRNGRVGNANNTSKNPGGSSSGWNCCSS